MPATRQVAGAEGQPVKGEHILAIDQGTTSSTAVVLRRDGLVVGRATVELPQHFPAPGWVEHDPEDIVRTVLDAIARALANAGLEGQDLAAVGIANQRETTLVWDRQGGRPLSRAIVWQDRRTAARCVELTAAGLGATVQERTGLVVDPYFSATKLQWLLDHVDGARALAAEGRIAFGTVESYLVHMLAGGSTGAPHVTDVTNASRTMLMDLRTRRWSPEMLELFRIPASVLPRIVTNAEVVATTRGAGCLPDRLPISGLAGDQHAALFGQACLAPGDAKCTYGTGAFLLVNTGAQPVRSSTRLLTTVAWELGSDVTYALEGCCFVAGAAVQWLRDGLGLIRTASEVETLARQVESADGVVFVPALAGLGAPYWDPRARGILAGITRGTTGAHIARATLEAIAHQVDDILQSMSADLGRPLTRLRVDGGASANDLLMQQQSDISGVKVERPRERESTARGAAMLAGIGAGFFQSGEEAARMIDVEKSFMVHMGDAERDSRRRSWRSAVRRALTPVDPTPAQAGSTDIINAEG